MDPESTPNESQESNQQQQQQSQQSGVEKQLSINDLQKNELFQAEIKKAVEAAKKEVSSQYGERLKTFEELHGQVESLLQGKTVDEVRAELEGTSKALRSAEKQRELDKQKLEEAAKISKQNEENYKKLFVRDRIKTPAAPLAATPKALEWITDELEKHATITKEGDVVVKVGDKELDPESAIEALSKEADYSIFFKSSLSGGSGSQSSQQSFSQGSQSSSTAMGMSTAEYIKARREGKITLDDSSSLFE